ncbi:MAG: periplasmic heavy metal sensor [Robiginitomaculum sp.]|nr:periplasmic heavy metal sensor [Robiginitomaculum sp.]
MIEQTFVPMKNTLLLIILSLVVGLGGVWIGKALFTPHAVISTDLHAEIHNSLQLSSKQEQQIHLLEKEFAKRKKVLENQLKAANGSIADAIAKDHKLSADVTEAGEQYLIILGELQRETLQHIFKMRDVLNEDQAIEFDKLVIRSLHAATK